MCRFIKLMPLRQWHVCMLAHTFVLLIAAAGAAADTPTKVCRTSAHGAKPSASRYATQQLQAAIDECGGDSCGRVVVDRPGAYLTASLRLSGCVHLELPASVTLLAGSQREDFGATQPEWYLLLFQNCTGCSLSGGGTVDGQARLWVLPQQGMQGQLLKGAGRQLQCADQQQRQPQESSKLPRKAVRNWADPSCPKPEECRPRLVGVLDSGRVNISGVTLTDPVYWCLHVLRSQHISIDGIIIRGDWGVPNNDGIDVDSSSHVSISHADVDTADDAICLKTTSPGHPLEHVTVSDCRLRSRSSAVKLGSESVADMCHISFARLAITDSHRGLAIQLRDGGSISQVRFSDIDLSTRYSHPSWWGAAEPIYVTALPRAPGRQVGYVRDVTFVDIRATAENGIFLSGGPLPDGGTHRGGSDGTSSSEANGGRIEGQHRRQGLQQLQQHGLRWQRRQRGQYSLGSIIFDRVQLRLRCRSSWPGGCQDYRPGSNISQSSALTAREGSGWWPAGLDCSSGTTAAVWVAGAAHVVLSDVQVEYCSPRRPDWRQQLHIGAASTHGVRLRNLSVTESSSCEDPFV